MLLSMENYFKVKLRNPLKLFKSREPLKITFLIMPLKKAKNIKAKVRKARERARARLI